MILSIGEKKLEINGFNQQSKCCYCDSKLEIAEEYSLYFCNGCGTDYEIFWDNGYILQSVTYYFGKFQAIYSVDNYGEILIGKKVIKITKDYFNGSLEDIRKRISKLLIFM